MIAGTSVIAKSLTPPFVIAILHDTEVAKQLANFVYRPLDEMVSLAPSQKGFLGVETTRNEDGQWISVSYWQDITACNTWRQVCAKRFVEVFPGTSFESLCRVKVANVKGPVVFQHTHHLKADKPVTIKSHDSKLIPRSSNLMFSIMEFFGRVSFR